MDFLDLSKNKLTRIQNLGALSRLSCLYLQGNTISSVVGLEGLRLLRVLNLSANAIEVLDDALLALPLLETLLLADNLLGASPDSLASLRALPPTLLELDLGGNALPAAAIDTLAALGGLRHLTLSENPLSRAGPGRVPNYRKFVLGCLQALTCLDHAAVSPQERAYCDALALRVGEVQEAVPAEPAEHPRLLNDAAWPEALLSHLLFFLPPRDLVAAALASSRWRHAAAPALLAARLTAATERAAAAADALHGVSSLLAGLGPSDFEELAATLLPPRPVVQLCYCLGMLWSPPLPVAAVASQTVAAPERSEAGAEVADAAAEAEADAAAEAEADAAAEAEALAATEAEAAVLAAELAEWDESEWGAHPSRWIPSEAAPPLLEIEAQAPQELDGNRPEEDSSYWDTTAPEPTGSASGLRLREEAVVDGADEWHDAAEGEQVGGGGEGDADCCAGVVSPQWLSPQRAPRRRNRTDAAVWEAASDGERWDEEGVDEAGREAVQARMGELRLTARGGATSALPAPGTPPHSPGRHLAYQVGVVEAGAGLAECQMESQISGSAPSRSAAHRTEGSLRPAACASHVAIVGVAAVPPGGLWGTDPPHPELGSSRWRSVVWEASKPMLRSPHFPGALARGLPLQGRTLRRLRLASGTADDAEADEYVPSLDMPAVERLCGAAGRVARWLLAVEADAFAAERLSEALAARVKT